jgi:hypothetical protein
MNVECVWSVHHQHRDTYNQIGSCCFWSFFFFREWKNSSKWKMLPCTRSYWWNRILLNFFLFIQVSLDIVITLKWLHIKISLSDTCKIFL